MNILGISAFYHDSAACLVQDGRIVAAAQEERFTRKKHDAGFPTNAVEFCCAEGGIRPEQVDLCVFYDKPLLKFERLLETYLAYSPAGFKQFLMALPLWLKQKLNLPREMDKGLGGLPRPLRVPRASRVARGQRVLPLAVRRRCDPHPRRRRRVGHR
jgi:carbamoyltransferase